MRPRPWHLWALRAFKGAMAITFAVALLPPLHFLLAYAIAATGTLGLLSVGYFAAKEDAP